MRFVQVISLDRILKPYYYRSNFLWGKNFVRFLQGRLILLQKRDFRLKDCSVFFGILAAAKEVPIQMIVEFWRNFLNI